jgi:hypothetical protein
MFKSVWAQIGVKDCMKENRENCIHELLAVCLPKKQSSEKEGISAICDTEKASKCGLRDRITIKKSVRSYCRTRAGYIGCFSAKN